MVVTYGVAHLFQAVATARTTARLRFDPGLLLRLARQPVYLAGIGCQIAAFVLAFFARRDLPLFLVQASVAAALGVTALLGVLILRWRLPAAEIVLLMLLLVGVTALIVSARPAPAHWLGPRAVAAIALAAVVIAALGALTARLTGPTASVLLGLLAGFAFSAAAIASRPLASSASYQELLTEPLLYLLIAHSAIGQWLIALAMQRGSVTAAIAAMDAAGAVPAAIVGLLLLNDKIWPGREWLAATGFLITLAAVLGMTRYATAQHGGDVAVVPAVAGACPGDGRPDAGQAARAGVAAGAVAA
jgi:drug/metabolite transporter (DMT)-like permease